LALAPDGVVLRLVEALGYTALDEEMHAFTGDYFSVLMEGSQLVNAASMKLKMLNMSDAEKEKHAQIQKSQQEYKAKMRAEAEYRKQMEEHSQKDRKVK